jgi:ATP-dependent HslUV protease ATP-binding subunit HslU
MSAVTSNRWSAIWWKRRSGLFRTSGCWRRRQSGAGRRGAAVGAFGPAAEKRRRAANPLGFLFQGAPAQEEAGSGVRRPVFRSGCSRPEEQRRLVRERLDKLRAMEERVVEIEVEDRRPPMLEIFSGQGMEEMGVNLQDILGNIMPARKKKRKVSVAEARRSSSRKRRKS